MAAHQSPDVTCRGLLFRGNQLASCDTQLEIASQRRKGHRARRRLSIQKLEPRDHPGGLYGLTLPLAPAIDFDGNAAAAAIEAGIVHHPTWRFPGEMNPDAIQSASAAIGLQFHHDQWSQLPGEFEYVGILYPEQLAAASGVDIPMISRTDAVDSSVVIDVAKLATDLAALGAQFFGAHWCGVCAMQKQSFGSAAVLLPYVELALPDGSPNQTARDEAISSFPTWRFVGDCATVESLYSDATRSIDGVYQRGSVELRDDGFQMAGMLQPVQLAAIVAGLSRSASSDSVQANRVAEGESSASPLRNPRSTFDVNDSGSVTALDALVIINFLNRQDASANPGELTSEFFVDVSGDGNVSALDALLVINQLNRADSNPAYLITGPTGTLDSIEDQKISWTGASLGSSETYDVALSTEATCESTDFVALRTGVEGLETPFFTEVTTNGDYFVCVTAVGVNNSRLTPNNQGVPVKIELERYHTVFFSKTTVAIPTGPLYLDTTSNLKYFDLKCTEFASNAGLISDWDGESVVYKAIMSDDFSDAKSRIGVQGKVIGTNNRVIADSEGDLWDGSIDLGLFVDEDGILDFSRPNSIHSGTNFDGSAAIGKNCNNWTSSSQGVGGITGGAGSIDRTWIDSGVNVACNAIRSLYCISPSRIR